MLNLYQGFEYECAGPCWGRVIGSGLQPNGDVEICASAPVDGCFATLTADFAGAIDANLNLGCGGGWTGVYAKSTTQGGAAIQSEALDSLCEPELLVFDDVYQCNSTGDCWGHVYGQFLKLNSDVVIHTKTPVDEVWGTINTGDDGKARTFFEFPCGENYGGVYASGELPDGSPITSETVDSPCE